MSTRRSSSVVLLAAMVLAGAACGSPGVPVPTTAAGTSSVATGPTRWSSVSDPSGGDAHFDDVSVVLGRVVAVGTTGSRSLVSTSVDGRSWAMAPDQPSFDTAGGSSMRRVISTADGALAVGAGDSQSAVWASGDGISWDKAWESKIPTDAEVAAGDLRIGAMASVAAVGARFIAVGVTTPGLIDDFGGAAWTSSDGRSWTYHEPTAQLLRAPLYAVAAVPSGVVAVGGIRGAVALTSPDGVDWTLHDLRDIVSDGQLRAVVRRQDGLLVAVGDGEGAISATSTDGVAWHPGVCNGTLDQGSMLAITVAGQTLVAAGSIGPKGAIWVSGDGLTWRRVRADLGQGEIHAITPTPAGLVAVGTRIWLGPADGVGDDGVDDAAPCGGPPPGGQTSSTSPDVAVTPAPSEEPASGDAASASAAPAMPSAEASPATTP